MPSHQKYYIYNPDRDLTQGEKQVLNQGFPFVSTADLGKPGSGETWRLNEHNHHSTNTHLIVSGSIKIGRAADNVFKLREREFTPGQYANMPSNVNYIGEAGPNGCVFVEGHTCLSPTSAQRFEERGTIVRARKNTPGAFTTS